MASAAAALLIGVRPVSAVQLTSFENITDGWTINTAENPDYAFAGFSTTTGVTEGTYAAVITGTAAPTYGQLLAGPSSIGMNAILGAASEVSIDVITDPNAFGFGTQWTASIANDDLGYTSLDGFSYTGFVGPGSAGTLTWDITATQRATLLSSANPTSLIFQVGGGAAGTMYVDNIRTTDVPEPAAACPLGAGALVALRRRGGAG